MKVTRDKTENSQTFLTIEMDSTEVEESLENSYRRLVQKTNVPGFRRGKAPRTMLERQIGKERLFQDGLNDLIPKAYERAIKEEEIEPFAQPEIEIIQREPVVLKVIVPLPPKIELGDYQQIQVKPEPINVTEDDINTAMEQLQHQHAIWEPVEHPLQANDLAVLDIESEIEARPFINRKGFQYQVLPGQSFPAPGFPEQLLEMKRGEEKEFKLQFPNDFARTEMVGKEASFRVKVAEVKQEALPELNDEFAKNIAPAFEALDKLREHISHELKHRAEEKTKADFEERVVSAAADLSQVEFPPVLVEVEISQLINQQLRRLQASGYNPEEYLKRINKTEVELREDMRPEATTRVFRSLMLGKIAEAEKIEVGDPEIDDNIETLTQNNPQDKDKLRESLNTPQNRESIKQYLLTGKTIQRLVEIASGSTTDADVAQKEEKNE